MAVLRITGGRALLLLAAVVLAVSAGLSLAAEPPSSGETGFDAPVTREPSFTVPGGEGVATVDGQSYSSVQRAVEAAAPGDTVVLSGVFDETVVVNTSDLTITSGQDELALINGSGEGDVVTLNGANDTLRRVWIRNSGFDASSNDAAVWLNSTDGAVIDARITETTFGVWIDGVDGVTIGNNTIVGRERVTPLSYRGNGVQVWKTRDSSIQGNHITDVRDGVYYSWASGVVARDNVLWDLRYGVHYMYSDSCRLVDNLSFDNDAGYALMVSDDLNITGNIAFNNTGGSGHGILVKSIDGSRITGNTLKANSRGFYVYNSLDNTFADNLVMENELGVYLAAGSVRERVVNNSFVRNGETVRAVMSEQVAWNSSGRGNYWSGARTVDRDGDGVSEVRYRPAGLVGYVLQRNPEARVFAHSPAFDVVRMAESSFPVIRSPGVVDHHPLVHPPHRLEELR